MADPISTAINHLSDLLQQLQVNGAITNLTGELTQLRSEMSDAMVERTQTAAAYAACLQRVSSGSPATPPGGGGPLGPPLPVTPPKFMPPEPAPTPAPGATAGGAVTASGAPLAPGTYVTAQATAGIAAGALAIGAIAGYWLGDRTAKKKGAAKENPLALAESQLRWDFRGNRWQATGKRHAYLVRPDKSASGGVILEIRGLDPKTGYATGGMRGVPYETEDRAIEGANQHERAIR